MKLKEQVAIAETLSATGLTLGEGPMWDAATQTCYWVDVEEKKLFEYNWNTALLKQHLPGQRVSFAVMRKSGGLVLGMQGGIAGFDPATGTIEWINDLGEDWSDLRCNDGGCDMQGRLWIGTMQLDAAPGLGSLYCLEKDRPAQKIIAGLTIPNGLAWSRDNRRLYHTDSVSGEVRTYSYEADSGAIVFEKTAFTVPEEMGVPDGMAMDEEGMLWVALWGGNGVGRWDLSTGKMIGFIEVPAPQVSCCAFAGAALDQLVITTASKGMTSDQLKKYPQSGNVFVVKAGVGGLPKHLCSL